MDEIPCRLSPARVGMVPYLHIFSCDLLALRPPKALFCSAGIHNLSYCYDRHNFLIEKIIRISYMFYDMKIMQRWMVILDLRVIT